MATKDHMIRKMYLSEPLIGALAPGEQRTSAVRRAGRGSTLHHLTPVELADLLKPLQEDPTLGIPIQGGPVRMVHAGDYTIVYVWGTAYGVANLLGKPSVLSQRKPTDVALWILDVHRTTTTERSEFRRRKEAQAVDQVFCDSARGLQMADAKVRKIPVRLQRDIDVLIEKSKRGDLTTTESQELEEMLDYLDDLTIHELERAAEATQ